VIVLNTELLPALPSLFVLVDFGTAAPPPPTVIGNVAAVTVRPSGAATGLGVLSGL
jgi:hypothetical protein